MKHRDTGKRIWMQFVRLIFLDYNKNLELQYRGRIYELNNSVRPRIRAENSKDELLNSMIEISKLEKVQRTKSQVWDVALSGLNK